MNKPKKYAIIVLLVVLLLLISLAYFVWPRSHNSEVLAYSHHVSISIANEKIVFNGEEYPADESIVNVVERSISNAKKPIMEMVVNISVGENVLWGDIEKYIKLLGKYKYPIKTYYIDSIKVCFDYMSHEERRIRNEVISGEGYYKRSHFRGKNSLLYELSINDAIYDDEQIYYIYMNYGRKVIVRNVVDIIRLLENRNICVIVVGELVVDPNSIVIVTGNSNKDTKGQANNIVNSYPTTHPANSASKSHP